MHGIYVGLRLADDADGQMRETSYAAVKGEVPRQHCDDESSTHRDSTLDLLSLISPSRDDSLCCPGKVRMNCECALKRMVSVYVGDDTSEKVSSGWSGTVASFSREFDGSFSCAILIF